MISLDALFALLVVMVIIIAVDKPEILKRIGSALWKRLTKKKEKQR